MKFRMRRVSTSGMVDMDGIPPCPWPDAKLEYDTRDPRYPEAFWSIEIDDISDLVDIMEKLDGFVIHDEPVKTIWLYDDYFE